MTTVKEVLAKAINHRKLVTFYYENKKRIVEPYHYGMLGEKLQLHCFQVEGDSESGGIPQWRNFQLTLIKKPHIQSKSHFSIRTSYHPENSHYTPIEKAVT